MVEEREEKVAIRVKWGPREKREDVLFEGATGWACGGRVRGSCQVHFPIVRQKIRSVMGKPSSAHDAPTPGRIQKVEPPILDSNAPML